MAEMKLSERTLVRLGQFRYMRGQLPWVRVHARQAMSCMQLAILLVVLLDLGLQLAQESLASQG
jgi:hypothetical protein